MATRGTEERPPEDDRRRAIRIEFSPRTLILLVLIISGLWLLIRAMPVVLVLVAALSIVGTVSPSVRWLEARGMRRDVGIAVVFTGLMLATVLFITLTVPAVIEQTTNLIETVPVLRARLADWVEGLELSVPVADRLRRLRVSDVARMSLSNALEIASDAVAVLAYLLSSVFLALYIMLDRDRLRGGLFLLVPMSHHVRLSRIMLGLETIVGGYIRGQVIISCCITLFVFVLLTACGVPNALALALFAGVADVLPYIGSLMAMIAVVAASLTQGLTVMMIVLTLMLAYEQLEGHVLVPLVYGRVLRLPSSVIFFSILAGAILSGFLGALLSLPVAATLLMLVQELRVELPGKQELLSDVKTKIRDERSEAEYERRAEGKPAEQAAAIAVEIAAEQQSKESAAAAKPAPPADADKKE